jgi:hypothetical protein
MNTVRKVIMNAETKNVQVNVTWMLWQTSLKRKQKNVYVNVTWILWPKKVIMNIENKTIV